MSRDSLALIGRPARELPTSALTVDLDRPAANIQTMARLAEAAGVAPRPRIKTHKTPAIAHMQRAAGAAGIALRHPDLSPPGTPPDAWDEADTADTHAAIAATLRSLAHEVAVALHTAIAPLPTRRPNGSFFEVAARAAGLDPAGMWDALLRATCAAGCGGTGATGSGRRRS